MAKIIYETCQHLRNPKTCVYCNKKFPRKNKEKRYTISEKILNKLQEDLDYYYAGTTERKIERALHRFIENIRESK